MRKDELLILLNQENFLRIRVSENIPKFAIGDTVRIVTDEPDLGRWTYMDETRLERKGSLCVVIIRDSIPETPKPYSPYMYRVRFRDGKEMFFAEEHIEKTSSKLTSEFKSIRGYQEVVKQWSQRNFGDQKVFKPLIGVGEELGEMYNALLFTFNGALKIGKSVGLLNHHYLKGSQGIRLNEDHTKGLSDALGDIFIYMCDFASRMGIDLNQAITNAWNEVKERDWKKNRKDGITNVS